jgi:transcriptional regulator with XRE-family HTH domain
MVTTTKLQGNPVEHFATSEKPFHFVDSGLENVYLVGIKYFVYPDGRVMAEIPAIKQLMRLIAHDIVKSSSELSGAEIKFLRKRLGKKATEYCRFLALEPETLSRIENGKQSISEGSQTLARLSYAILSEDPQLKELALSIMKALSEALNVKPQKEPIVLEVTKNNEWLELKKAA